MNKEDFVILNREVNGKRLVYLDSAATSLKPKVVVDAITSYYNRYCANVHRGIHTLSEEATVMYESVREKVAALIHCDSHEVVFTSGMTHSMNLLVHSLGKTLNEGDEVIVTEMEHHSGFVGWQQVAKERGAVLKVVPVVDGKLDMDAFSSMLSSKTKIVSVMHVSNVLGVINPIKEIIDKTHAVGALCIIDGAQSVPHMKVDVKELDCDFFIFSAHKMCGPTGVGVLYGKKNLLERMDPLMFGGDMIKEVTIENTSWNDVPYKFEAGTPNIAGVIGFGAAIDYLLGIGLDKVSLHEKELVEYAVSELKKIDGVHVFSFEEQTGVVSFSVEGIPPHDMSTLLDREGVAIRAGTHCAMPLMKKLGMKIGTCRASFYLYNTKEDVDVLVDAVIKAKGVFKV